jgi:hypothetical protein
VIEIDYIKLNSKNRSTVNEEEKFLCVWIVYIRRYTRRVPLSLSPAKALDSLFMC